MEYAFPEVEGHFSFSFDSTLCCFVAIGHCICGVRVQDIARKGGLIA
jgi:hypothetical protein